MTLWPTRLAGLLVAGLLTWWVISRVRPTRRLLRAAVLAGGVSFLVHLFLLDLPAQARGLLRYTVSGLTLWGIPLDFHLTAALVWGVIFALLFPAFYRWLGARLLVSGAVYIAVWTVVSGFRDWMVSRWSSGLIVWFSGGLVWNFLAYVVLLGLTLGAFLWAARGRL